MKNFLKQVFAVIVGMTIFQVIATIIAFVFIAAIVATLDEAATDTFSSNTEIEVNDNSVLWMDLSYPIMDKRGFTDFDILAASEMPQEQLGLRDIMLTIDKAKYDERVEGIHLPLSFVQTGYANVDAIRRALLDFKDSGKFITAYGEVVSQKAYYLASVADDIYVNPKGIVELRGIGTRLTFFKKLLEEKLDAEVRVFKVGTFKSAVEPFIREDISEENRQQLEFLLGGIKEDFLQNISDARGISTTEFDEILNTLAIRNTQDAVDANLIDGAWYYDEVLADLKERTGTAGDEKLEYIEMGDYYYSAADIDESGDYNIAVLYAEGDIVDGKGDELSIGSAKYAKEIKELREDDNVDAIVFRINSGGGSALASEVIWREVILTKEVKPFVVSMGNVAASGGYYIACDADRIFAEENTITGSIGVFGLMPNLEDFFANKVGVTFDDVKLNEHATFDGLTKGLDDYEAMVIQQSVNEVYETFTSRVAEGREMEIDTVKKYAEGRVWTGEQALEIGFVDELGGLNDALNYTAEMAGHENYKVTEYPAIRGPFEEFMEGLGGNTKETILKKEMGEYYQYLEQIKRLDEMQKGVQTRLPYQLEIN
ncbi:MAG: signal peptide peptidase SppA [Chitinophagales bacterium]